MSIYHPLVQIRSPFLFGPAVQGIEYVEGGHGVFKMSSISVTEDVIFDNRIFVLIHTNLRHIASLTLETMETVFKIAHIKRLGSVFFEDFEETFLCICQLICLYR